MSDKAKVQQVTLNIDEMKTFLSHIVHNNRFLQEQGKPTAAVEIQGESGIGKTSTAIQLAAELGGLSVVKLNLAQIEELGDLVGFPVRQFQLCKQATETPKTKMVDRQVKDKDGNIVTRKVSVPLTPEETEAALVADCLWIDEQAVQEYTHQGYHFTGKKRMSYCPPEWIADKQTGGFLILDDWNRADIRFIQAVMELVDRQEYISWKMPKDWHILLTANPDDGEYLVQSIDVAQRTRFISVFLKFDAEVWARWAEKEKIDGRCINFLLMNPELISAKVNPRSITTFFNAISSIPDFSTQLPLIQMIGEGSVGPEFSTMFTTFINNKLDKLISPKDILLHANESFILGELRGCIGRDKDYRADIASILTTRLINYTINYAETNPITQANIDRLTKLMTDPDTLTDDLKYVLVKRVLNGNKAKFQKLMVNPDVIKMSLK